MSPNSPKTGPETKVVYATTHPKKDALLVRDEDGIDLEISGAETTEARLSPGGLEKLYRDEIMPYFCKNGENLEIRGPNNNVIWKSY